MYLLVIPAAALAQSPPAKNPFQEAMQKQRAAIAIQREAVKKQADLAKEWRAPSLSEIAPPPADCDPIADVELTPMIDAAAQKHSVEPKLIRAVIEQESGLRPCALSPKGAQGLMQLMPETAGQLGVEDPFDAKENVEGGARYLKGLLDKYKGDVSLALAAYNAGPSAVDQAGRVPEIPETVDYINAILKNLDPGRLVLGGAPKPPPANH